MHPDQSLLKCLAGTKYYPAWPLVLLKKNGVRMPAPAVQQRRWQDAESTYADTWVSGHDVLYHLADLRRKALGIISEPTSTSEPVKTAIDERDPRDRHKQECPTVPSLSLADAAGTPNSLAGYTYTWLQEAARLELHWNKRLSVQMIRLWAKARLLVQDKGKREAPEGSGGGDGSNKRPRRA